MNHIRKFESYSKKRKLDQVIKESVMMIGDIYKVNVSAEITQSLLNAYIKKVKDNLDKNARQFYSDQQLAEEIVKYVLTQGLDVDKLDAAALFGGTPQAQTQGSQVQVQPQSQPQIQGQPAQGQVAPQAQPVQGQAQGQPAQLDAQGQPLPQAQPVQGQGQPVQGQAQPQGQPVQGQAQPQGQDSFEEVQDEDEDEKRRRTQSQDEDDELPL